HRAVAAARSADVDVPSAAAKLTRIESRSAVAGARPARPGLLVHPPVRAELVVLAALVGVAEHLVRLVDFLELRLGGLVARIDVRMVLARQLPVRLLDFLFRRGLRDAER